MNKIDKEAMAIMKIESEYRIAMAYVLTPMLFLICSLAPLVAGIIPKRNPAEVVLVTSSMASGILFVVALIEGGVKAIIRYHFAYELWLLEEME